MQSKEIIVSVSLGKDIFTVGRLWCHLRGDRQSASFEYAREWLEHPERFSLEPALQLTEGAFHTQAGAHLFGAIGDSAPDRWGRVLMRRHNRKHAESNNQTPTTLFEADYLLGVNDEARQGALRFSIPPETNKYLAESDQRPNIPTLLELPALLSATERFIDENENAQDLQLLLAPGSSLGGARPKACIKKAGGELAIAKFPRNDDEYDVVLWEAVALTLATHAKIETPTWQLELIHDNPVLVVDRFDRDNEERIPFLSAMSMLGAQDNEQHSYLEIAYAITQHSHTPQNDLAELWRRIVFTIFISNTDDHLRNHGFLYSRHQGWGLSPAYDLNPTPIDIKPHILTTAIDFEEAEASIDLAKSVIDDFRLTNKQADSIICEVREAVQQWQAVATKLGLSKQACSRMSSAFRSDL